MPVPSASTAATASTLPSTLSSLLWSGGPSSLCGIALGDVVDAAALPAWWNDSHSEGSVRFGWLEVGDAGVAQVGCSVRLAHGRASSVDISFELDDDVAEERVFADVCATVQARLGAAATAKKSKEATWESVTGGAFKSDVIVKRSGFSSDEVGEVSRVEVVLTLSQGEEIKADARALFVDVDALADLLESPAWPQERAKDALTAWFRHEYPGQASSEERSAIWSLHDAVLAAHGTDADKRRLLESVLALADVSDLSYNGSSRTSFLLDGLVSHVTQSAHPRTWVGLSLRDVWPWFELLKIPADERRTWLRVVVVALAFSEPAALAQVAARLREHPPASPSLPFASAPDVVARAYGLLSAHLADDVARLLWVKEAGHDAARAAVTFFAVARGVVVAHVDWPPHAYYAPEWGPWLMVAKAQFPAAFDDALAVFVERSGHDQRGWRAVLNVVADDQELGAKSTWRAGGWVFTHSGKETRGRWTAAPAATTAAKKTTKTPKTKTATKAEMESETPTAAESGAPTEATATATARTAATTRAATTGTTTTAPAKKKKAAAKKT